LKILYQMLDFQGNAMSIVPLRGDPRRCRRVTTDDHESFAPSAMTRSPQQAVTTPGAGGANPPQDGSVLPFPPVPMAGLARPRLQDSTPAWPGLPQHLPPDAPNIPIVLLDDVGFGVAETFGG
jgi:hypothetical protein